MKGLLLIFATALCLAAQAPKRFEFRGRVERIDAAGKRLSVHNEPLPGWMGEMTMGYGLDNPDVLGSLKPGDQITATVFEGDLILHGVTLAAAPVAVSGAGLSLEVLEEMALAGNPTLAQADANLRAAAGLARQAGLYPNPTVGYYGEELRGGTTNGGKQGVFVNQTIVLGGKLGAARRAADLQTSQVRSGAGVQKARVLNNVRWLFYQTLAAQRLVALRQDLAKLAADVSQTSRQLGNIGQADRPDILQAEVEQQQAELSVALAERDLDASWRVLAALVGKPEMKRERLAGDLDAIPELDYAQALDSALRESPEVTAAQQAVARAEAGLTVERRAPIPDLQISGSVGQNRELLETTRRPTGIIGGVQLGVEVPIFNRNQGSIAAARAEVESAKQGLERLRLQIGRNMAEAFRDYSNARVTVLKYRDEMLPRAEQAYTLYQRNYGTMAGPYAQVLLSQRTLFQLRSDYVKALATAWEGAIAIRGFGLMDGLAEPMVPRR